MNLKKNLHWLIYLLFVCSCARQSQPMGGPKDTIPPILLSSIPAQEQINYKGKTLELNFDEIVSLQNPKEQMIITPSIGKEFKAEVRQRKVLITFENPLSDSTTYTFNFREAVKDVTESNPAKNLKIAFSTGSYIDSMSIEGLVFHAIQQKPMKDVTVAIQPYNDTFNIFKHPATYFTKSDEKGVFQIENLKPGLYTIYAVADQNKNLIADPKNEAYGFKRDSILLDENKKNLLLNLVRLDIRPLKLTSARPYNTYFNIKATKNLKDFKIETEDSTDVYSAFGPDRANILVYNSFPGKDSVRIRTVLSDSLNNRVDTTFYMKFSEREATPEKFQMDLSDPTVLADKGEIKLTLTFSKPLKELNFDSIFFNVDSLNVIPFTAKDVDYNEPERKLTLRKHFDPALYVVPEQAPEQPVINKEEIKEKKKTKQSTTPKVKNRLLLGKGAFISIEQDSSGRLVQTISPRRTPDLGVISAELKQAPQTAIIQLLNKSKLLVGEVIHKKNAVFNDLPPDEYVLRIIVDRNGNGVWDPGNYLLREEPEEIHYWKDEKGVREIKLKANFEIGPLLITY
jgi:uncharacterized protein (DUF2141 family)